jgi:copper chaperone NosL
MRAVLLLAVALILGACREDEASALPPAVAMTEEALGHYCQMNLVEHPGPKAQVHLSGMQAPIFFSQVRDAVAYMRMPEQSHAIAAVYVSDMSRAPSWEDPGKENWIAVDAVHFVVGAETPGGMGAPELVPFSQRADAEAFAARQGGAVVSLGEISDDEVLAPVEFQTDADGNFIPPEQAMDH